MPWAKIERQRHEPKSGEAYKKLVSKLIKRDNKKRKLLESKGIDYEFPGYVSNMFTCYSFFRLVFSILKK